MLFSCLIYARKDSLILQPMAAEPMNIQSETDNMDASSTAVALAMMKQELPQYLQNMLLACGYDRLQIIAEMNVNQTEYSQPNDVDRILSYIQQTSPSDSRLVHICIINNISVVIYTLDFVVLNGEIQYLIYLLDIGF